MPRPLKITDRKSQRGLWKNPGRDEDVWRHVNKNYENNNGKRIKTRKQPHHQPPQAIKRGPDRHEKRCKNVVALQAEKKMLVRSIRRYSIFK